MKSDGRLAEDSATVRSIWLDNGHDAGRDGQRDTGASGQVQEAIEVHIIEEQLGQQMLGTRCLLDAQVLHIVQQGVGLGVGGHGDFADILALLHAVLDGVFDQWLERQLRDQARLRFFRHRP